MESKNPYQTPSTDVSTQYHGETDQTSPFSASGRFGRLSFIAWGTIVGIISNIVSTIFGGSEKDRRFNRITGGMAGTIPPERGSKQGHQEARRGGNRRGNARMSGSREDSRVVGEGNAQEPTPSPVALVDGEVRYH